MHFSLFPILSLTRLCTPIWKGRSFIHSSHIVLIRALSRNNFGRFIGCGVYQWWRGVSIDMLVSDTGIRYLVDCAPHAAMRLIIDLKPCCSQKTSSLLDMLGMSLCQAMLATWPAINSKLSHFWTINQSFFPICSLLSAILFESILIVV